MNVYWLEQIESDVRPDSDWFCANEDLRLRSLRFAKRRADWRLGRWTAKRALAAFLRVSPRSEVLARIEICSAPSGAPEVLIDGRPLPLAISLSHRAGRALCAIALRDSALGCDLELIEPRSDGFLADYFSDEEQALVRQASLAQRPALLALLWSAKESALKALRTGLRLDTRCVVVHLLTCSQALGELDAGFNSPFLFGTGNWHALQVNAPNGETFHGYWQRSGEFLRTVVASPPPSPPIVLNLSSKEWRAQKEATNEPTIHSAA